MIHIARNESVVQLIIESAVQMQILRDGMRIVLQKRNELRNADGCGRINRKSVKSLLIKRLTSSTPSTGSLSSSRRPVQSPSIAAEENSELISSLSEQ